MGCDGITNYRILINHNEVEMINELIDVIFEYVQILSINGKSKWPCRLVSLVRLREGRVCYLKMQF